MVAALLELYPFSSLYIADLDAILQTDNNLATIRKLRQRFDKIDIWLDAGACHPSQVDMIVDLGLKCIIASERMESVTHYEQLIAKASDADTFLSLDFDLEGFMGPAKLFENPDIWPSKLLCMTLGRVGSYEGPDWVKLEELMAKSGQRKIYAAGGIRSPADLQQLEQCGVAGALVASALHDRKIVSSHIARSMK